MRKFKLLNERGEEFDLMRKDAFFHAPDGLGISQSVEMEQSGDYAFITDRKLSLDAVSGEMVFKGYEQYDEFTAFLTDTVTLCYQSHEIIKNRKRFGVWHYRECSVFSLGKTEIETYKRLVCPIEFTPLSPWYSASEIYIADISESISGYDYTYPFIYTEYERNAVKIINNSSQPAPCKLTIYGSCQNPSWAISQNAKTILSGAVNISLDYGESLIVDANPRTMDIAKYSANGVRTDAYQYSDFTTERFIYAPSGESTFRLWNSGSEAITAMLEVREQNDAV